MAKSDRTKREINPMPAPPDHPEAEYQPAPWGEHPDDTTYVTHAPYVRPSDWN